MTHNEVKSLKKGDFLTWSTVGLIHFCHLNAGNVLVFLGFHPKKSITNTFVIVYDAKSAKHKVIHRTDLQRL